MGLANLYVELGAKIGEFQAGMATAQKEIVSFNRSHEESMTGFQIGSKKAAVGAGIVAASMVALGAKAVSMAGNFQASQTRLVTTAGESASNLRTVSAGILSLSGQVGVSAQDLSRGMYTVESAGYHGAKALSVLKASAQGARMENADLGTVANAVTSIMRDYGSKAGDAATITSKLVTAVSVGKTNFQDLSGAMNAVMPKAAAAGLSFSEISADIASMTAHGESAAESSQNMADAISHLQSPTHQMTKAMADYGVQASDVSKNLDKRGLAGTMQMLSKTILSEMGPAGVKLKSTFNQSSVAAQDAQKMFQNLPPAARAVAASYKSGTMSVADYRTAIKKLPADQVPLLSSWKGQQDAAHGFANALKTGGNASKTYESALQAMTGDSSSLNVALMLTGENTKFVNANIAKVSKASKDASGNVVDWREQQKTLNQQLSQAKSAAGAMGIAIGTDMLPMVTKAAQAMSGFANFAEQNKGTVEAIGATLGALAVGVLALTAAVKVAQAAQVAWTIATKAWAVVTKAAAVAQAAFDVVLHANPIGFIIAAIALLVTGLVLFFTKTKLGREIWSDFTKFLVSAGKACVDGVVAAWHWLERTTESVWNGITAFFKKWGSYLVGFLLGGPIGLIVVGISKHWSTIKADTEKVWNAISSFFTSIWDGLKSSTDKGASAISNGIGALWSWVRSTWSSGVHEVSQIWSSLWSDVKSLASEGISGVQTFVRSGLDFVEGIFKAAGRLMHGDWSGAWADLRSATSSGISDLESLMNGIPGKVASVFSGAAQWLWDAGVNVMQGLIGGIESDVSSVISTAESVGHSVVTAVAHAIDAHSPSKEAIKLGRFFDEGLAQGLTGSVSKITSAARTLFTDASAYLTRQASDHEASIRTGLENRLSVLRAHHSVALKEASAYHSAYEAAVRKHHTALAASDKARWQSAASTASSYASQISATQRSLWTLTHRGAADWGAQQADSILGAGFEGEIRTLETDRNRLTTLAAQITSAQKEVATLQKDRASQISSMQQTFSSADTITSAASDGSVIAYLQQQAGRITAYRRQLKQLASEGLDNHMLQQLAEAGLDGQAAAEQLLNSGRGGIAQANRLSDQITSTAASIATDTGNSMYNAGIATAEGLVKGLQSSQSKVTAAMKHLANSMVATLRRELDIHSPSKRLANEVGQFLPAGVAEGVTAHLGVVRTAMKSLSDTVHLTPGAGGYAPSGTSSGTVTLEIPTQVQLDGTVIFKDVQKRALQWQIRNGRPAFALK